MMVRINLLPGKRKQAKEDAGQTAQVAALILFIAVVAVCYWIWQGKKTEIATAQAGLKGAQTKIDQAQKELKAIGDLEARSITPAPSLIRPPHPAACSYTRRRRGRRATAPRARVCRGSSLS